MWAIVELMGHVKIAGELTEVEQFGVKMGRIDIPMSSGSTVTQFFGGQSVYRITPTTEEIVREYSKNNVPRPIQYWDIKGLLPREAIMEDNEANDPDDLPDAPF